MVDALLSCAACGTANPAQASFCNSCGQSLQAKTQTSPLNNILHRRYQILEQLGQGGFGSVYKAADQHFNGRFVAIKEMEQKGLSPQELVEATANFKQEALLLAHLRHPNLPRIYDHFSESGRWYVVMDYIEGETLEDYLQKVPSAPSAPPVPQKLPLDEVLEIGIQLCSVLDYLHTRTPPVIFRDLKPSNVMYTREKHLYLIDFGIARHFKQGQTKDTMPLGSPGYAAPEQYGKAQTTPRADIYSLGVTLHELLTGDDPSQTPFRLAAIQSPDQKYTLLDALLKRMTAIDEKQRPATITAVKAELQHIARQENTRRVWTMEHFAPASTPSEYDYPVSDSSQAQSQQQLLERPQKQERSREGQQPGSQKEQSAGPVRSRRRVLAGLAILGLGAVSIPLWQTLSPKAAQPTIKNEVQNAKPTTVPELIKPSANHVMYKGHTGAVTSAVWLDGVKRIVSAGCDGIVRIWNAFDTNGEQEYHIVSGSDLEQMVLSPDGTRVVSAEKSGKTIEERHATSGKLLFTYPTSPAYSNDLVWSPDGRYLAIGVVGSGAHESGPPKKDDEIQIWDTSTHTLRTKFATYFPEGIAWSPDGKQLAVNSTFGETTVYDAATGASVASHSGFTNSMRSVVWSPDGTYVASASDSATIHVWIPDASSQKIISTFSSADGGIATAMSWSPDGKRIAIGTQNGGIEIWDALAGVNLTKDTITSSPITSIQWSPDGNAIVAGRADGIMDVWTVE